MKLAYLALATGLIASPLWAQETSAPASIAAVISICEPVIDEEYRGDTTRWGTCVKATEAFLTAVYGPPPSVDNPNAVVADLVVELAALYRPVDCPAHPSELPEAIEKALSFSSDPEQAVAMQNLADDLAACVDTSTGEIPDPVPASPIQ